MMLHKICRVFGFRLHQISNPVLGEYSAITLLRLITAALSPLVSLGGSTATISESTGSLIS